MHVVVFHPARLPVGKYGGTERVVVWLVRGLARLGVRVTLIAGRGTTLDDTDVMEVHTRTANRHDFDLSPFIPAGADLVHYFVPVHRPPRIPYLWTMQGNARPGFQPGPRCVFVSRDHARRHGSAAWVYNGVDPAEYLFRREKSDSLLFLGRLSSAKGWRDAIRVARSAGRPLVLAGGWRPSLDRNVRFLGAIGGSRKREVLSRAAALLMPVRWLEPFGIVIPEAWASGTPVIGTPRGSLTELITPEVGGLAETDTDLVRLVGRIGEWNADDCRRRLESGFTHLAMARGYLRQYMHLLEHGSPAPGQIST